MAEWLPLSGLILLSLLLGGSANPLCDMMIELAAIAVAMISAIRFHQDDWRRMWPAGTLVLVALAVTVIELIPIPYGLWRSLPGHQAPAALLDLLHLSGDARPLSLDPAVTAGTLIQIIPGIVAFSLASIARPQTQRFWLLLILAGAGACVLLGMLQIGGQTQFYLYQQSNFGEVTGLFANHNHASDLLLIGIAIIASHHIFEKARWPGGSVLVYALITVLAFAVLLTASRVGIVLLAAEIAIIAALLRKRLDRKGLLFILAFAALCLVAVGIIFLNPNIGHALDRFNDFSADLRSEIWSRTVVAMGHYWPTGSGLGTFVPVYTTVESLDTMPSQVVNHVHNEYLELLLELGAIGGLIILGYAICLGLMVTRVLRLRMKPEAMAAMLGLAILLIHSFVEFPLRNESLMVTFGLLNGILLCAAQHNVADNAGIPA